MNSSADQYNKIMGKVFGNSVQMFNNGRNSDYANLLNKVQQSKDSISQYAEENRRKQTK